MTEQGMADGTTATGGILPRGEGGTIAFNRLAGKNPGIVFIHGFMSDMNGSKALAVEAFCRRRGQAFVRFDASGHGQSSGRFEDGTISSWAADTVSVLDHLTEGPQILVGSSMGGWLMLLAALQRRERVVGLVGLAAAPDFTEDLISHVLTPEQKQTLAADGVVKVAEYSGGEPYPITRELIEDGRRNLVLSGPIQISCPVRLIHGQRDLDVPWQTALRLQDGLTSTDVEVTLVKSGEHRLSEPADIERMYSVLEGLLRRVEGA